MNEERLPRIKNQVYVIPWLLGNLLLLETQTQNPHPNLSGTHVQKQKAVLLH